MRCRAGSAVLAALAIDVTCHEKTGGSPRLFRTFAGAAYRSSVLYAARSFVRRRLFPRRLASRLSSVALAALFTFLRLFAQWKLLVFALLRHEDAFFNRFLLTPKGVAYFSARFSVISRSIVVYIFMRVCKNISIHY